MIKNLYFNLSNLLLRYTSFLFRIQSVLFYFSSNLNHLIKLTTLDNFRIERYIYSEHFLQLPFYSQIKQIYHICRRCVCAARLSKKYPKTQRITLSTNKTINIYEHNIETYLLILPVFALRSHAFWLDNCIFNLWKRWSVGWNKSSAHYLQIGRNLSKYHETE